MNYFCRSLKPVICLALISLLTAAAAVQAAPAVLRMKRPGVLKFLNRILPQALRSPLMISIDKMTGMTHLLNLFITAGQPAVMVIESSRQSPTASRPGGPIRVITANLLLFPAPFFFNQYERIDEFARMARSINPEIIFLQEVWDNNCLDRLLSLFPDYHATVMPSLFYNPSGLLTLSRFRIEQAGSMIFPLSLRHNIEELLARKGVLISRANFNGHQLFLLNTHLYSSPLASSFRPNPDQFRSMVSLINSLPGHVVTGGDMNLLPEELEALLKGNIVRDDCNLPTAGAERRSKKLDYILGKGDTGNRAEVRASRIEWPQLFSDHSAVFGEVRFFSGN